VSSVNIITLAIALPLRMWFARTNFRFKNSLLFAILLGAAFTAISTLIPFYAMYLQLGLAGTLTVSGDRVSHHHRAFL